MNTIERRQIGERAIQLYHVVLLRHASTGAPVHGLSARLAEPAWPHWILREGRAEVLLIADDRFADERPQETVIAVEAPSPHLQSVLAANGDAEVTLTRGSDPETTLLIEPAEMRVVVELVDRDGEPVTGRTVRVRGENGMPDVDLAEIEASGIYQSELRRWSASYRTLRVRVNNRQVGRELAVDFASAETRVRLVNA